MLTFYKDLLAMVTPELTAVLSMVTPLITPITTFAFTVAGDVADSGEGTAIRTAAFDVVGAASTLLSPVTGVVAGLI